MAVEHPWWKKAICYIFCEWFTKPVFNKRLCVCAYDILGVKKHIKREIKGKDGGFKFLRAPKIIAFIGLDGSGKSTQAKNVGDFLKKNGFKTSYLHLVGKVIPKKVSLVHKKKNDPKKPKILISLLRQFAFLVGIILTYLIHIIPNFLRGRITIADRWFYDELVHLNYLNTCSFPKLYRILIPKPGFLIYLDVDAKTAEKRKPEHNSDYFIIKEKLYAKLSNKIKAEKVESIKLNKTKENIEKILSNKLKYSFD